MYEFKRTAAPLVLKADGDEGSVSAVFSTFNVLDKGNDIVLANAFTHGQQVPMTWSHRWDLPVGRGVVSVEADQAVFDGKFFLTTTAGRDAYETVKSMGDLQQWSWGFKVTDAAFEQRDGELVRIIKRADLYEVSPVLVGEGEGTHTRDIKGLTFDDHYLTALAAAKSLADRLVSLAETRTKEGRTLSAANIRRMREMLETLEQVRGSLKSMLDEYDQPDKAALVAYLEFQRIMAGR